MSSSRSSRSSFRSRKNGNWNHGAHLDIEPPEIIEHREAVIKALQEAADNGDLNAEHKLLIHRFMWHHWKPAKRLKFLCCSLGYGLGLNVYRKLTHDRSCSQPNSRRFTSKQYCFERWFCPYCYTWSLRGIRPNLKPDAGPKEKTVTSNRLGQLDRWEAAIRDMLRNHTFYLGSAKCIVWLHEDGLDREKVAQFDRMLKAIKTREMRAEAAGDVPYPWMLPVRVSPLENAIRTVFLGVDAEFVRGDFSSTSTTEKSSHTNSPARGRPKSEFKGWHWFVEREIPWLELRRPLGMNDSDCFAIQLHKVVEWLAGDITPTDVMPERALEAYEKFKNNRLFRMVSNVKRDRIESDPKIQFLQSDDSLTIARDSGSFLGEDRFDGHKISIDSQGRIVDECPECGVEPKYVVGL